MITFAPYRTPRLTVQLRELSIGDSIELCARPPNRYEASATALLQRIVVPPERIVPGQVTDPRLWTVHERGAVSAHYLAHTLGGDFSIGDKSKFSDFLFSERQVADDIHTGPVGDDEWIVSPLLGYQAEAIERLIVGGRVLGKRMGWIMAAMACQMRLAHEPPLEDVAEAVFDEWLLNRISIFVAYPETDFADLLDSFLLAHHQLNHLLRAGFNDEGVVFISEVPGLPPARFPVSDLLSERTAKFLGIPTEPAG